MGNADVLLLHIGKLRHKMVIFSPKVAQKASDRMTNETSIYWAPEAAG